MSDSGKAVFLSYASQDTAAARKICDALRAAGVEVWFDQSELVGGDAWDQKIRKQIKDCALLIPVISASTQARHEGYFRLEWRLADQRTHLMGRSKAFLLPVSIDGTRDADADVPDSFVAVQWTKAPGGTVPPAFVARVKQLLDGNLEKAGNVGGALRPDSSSQSGRKAPPTQNAQRWLKPALGAAVVAAIALVIAQPWKKPAPLVPVSAPARTDSESEQLVAKAWKQLNEPGMARAELEVADGLCRRATEINPESSDAWAAWSFVDSGYCYHALGNTLERREGARAKAARALQLSPSSFEARLAQANYLVCDGSDASISMFAPEAERLLRALLHERPAEPRALLAFALLQRNLGHFDEARQALQTMAQNPAAAVLAWHELAWVEMRAGEPARAMELEDRSIAVQPVRSNLTGKMMLLAAWEGDLEGAAAVLAQIPAAAMQEDYTVSAGLQVTYWRRDAAALSRLAGTVPREWLQSNWFRGPLAWWKGLAEQLAGNADGARVHWLAAMKLVDKRLADAPSSAELIAWKGRLHAQLGEKAEAEKALDLAYQMGMKGAPVDRWHDEILLGRSERALDGMDAALRAGRTFWAATLRLAPQYDPIRDHPRFLAIQAQLDADARCNPRASAKKQTSAGATPDSKSVAVLAFANLSDDKANEYFSDGISEELLNVLAKISGLKVAARTSAFYFKGKEVPIPEIAKQLGVAYVVEGSVRKSGDKVRITAQLIKAADGFHVWSDTFTRDIKDVFAVQDEIAGLIAQQLQLKFADLPARDQPVNPEAHQLYLQGRYFANQPSTTNLAKAVDFLQRAVDLDPTFAPAWGALARNVALQAEYLETTPESLRERFARARRAADRAIALAPKLPDGYFARFEIQTAYDYDWRGARESLDLALALAPADALLVSNASQLATFYANVPRSLELGRRAAELDPVNAEIRYWLGRTYACAGLLAEGEAELRRAAELSPSLLSVHRQLSTVLVLQGRAAEAVQEARLEKDEWSRQASLAVACWAAKDVPAADAALARLIEAASESAAFQVAEGYAFRGESDRAFEWLDRAYRNRDSGFGQLRADPLLMSLHSDPRWVPLLKQAGLADEQLR